MSQFQRMAALAGPASPIVVGTATPADAWNKGTYLRTGDSVCTNQSKSDLGPTSDGVTTARLLSVTCSTVDTIFQSGPELTLLEMCATNISSSPVSVGFELQAG